MEQLKDVVKAIVRRTGYKISRCDQITDDEFRRRALIKNHGIDSVVDVGANQGQYASELRRCGYKGEILSFEPLSEAYEALQKAALADPEWHVFHSAIGAQDGEAEINVAANSVSSSLLPMLETHLRNAPTSRYRATERVKVSTLDSALKDVLPSGRRVLLKIDTQGYEREVLAGAKSVLQNVHLLECELSLVPLYEGQALLIEMLVLLDHLGFQSVYFAPGFGDQKSGHCLQLDGTFARGSASPSSR
jgi:FkbM family methyltransferase